MDANFLPRVRRHLPWLAALLLWTAGAAFAQAETETDPPGRVANLSYRQGGVVFAPQGEDEWVDLPVNRPLTVGDRLWSDKDARAELHLGTAAIQVDGESHLGVSALDDNAAQFILMQGSVNARVRELVPGENFEIDTPNLAFRAQQPGDFRIDVDAGGRETRITVRSGSAVVFGEGGQSVNLGAGQQVTFAGRFLAQVQQPAARSDDFDQFAAERNRAEDQSVAARHIPRGVVGYPQLDQHGTWAEDATHGQVWYPQVTVQDWAPYRYGRWEHIQPWGWTWIDDAPWGFAPFHYGRWAQIGPRWAWVPGRIAPRPLYAPALVAFFGGSGGSLTISSGPGVGWYPLGPGEAWWPSYRYSTRYVTYANPFIDLHRYHRNYYGHMHRQRPYAVTAVREDDFRHGRPVRSHWRSVSPAAVGQAQVGIVPQRPERRERGERYAGTMPRLQAAPPRSSVAMVPSRQWGPQENWGRGREPVRQQREERNERADRNDGNDRYDRNDGRRGGWVQQAPQPQAPQQAVRPANPQQPWAREGGRDSGRDSGTWERERAVREQDRAQREQQRLQADAERNAREQMRQQNAQRQQHQQEQAVRQLQERQQREGWQRQRGEERPARGFEQRAAPQMWPQPPQAAHQGGGFGPPQMRAMPPQPAAPIAREHGGERHHRADHDRGRGAERGDRGGDRGGRGEGRVGQRGDDEGQGRGRGRGG